MKKFVVIGLGSFGTNIAKSLALKGNDVIAIDTDNKKIDDLKDFNNINTAVADATKTDILENIDIKDADAVIVSLGPKIEPSILVVHNLKRLNIKNIIAKSLSEKHSQILQKIGADRIIYPEKDEAIRLSNILNNHNVIDYIPITDNFKIYEIICPKKYQNRSIKELDIRNKFNILIIGILDKFNVNKFEIPYPNTFLKENHTMLLLGTEKDIIRFSS